MGRGGGKGKFVERGGGVGRGAESVERSETSFRKGFFQTSLKAEL